MKNILIIGATSTIALACARIWTQQKSRFVLIARDPQKLQQTAQDLTARGAESALTHILDVNDYTSHANVIHAAFENLKTIDLVLVAHGTLPRQDLCEKDVNLAVKEFNTNGLSVISLLTLIAEKMEKQGSGTIAVISSVAGDRGRPSNYLYGSAKAAVTAFCAGLRARLYKKGVHVITIKPGFVDTAMTKGLPLPGPLVSSPEKVAKIIVKKIDNKSNSVYVPSFWCLIMTIIKSIPEGLFKKLNL